MPKSNTSTELIRTLKDSQQELSTQKNALEAELERQKQENQSLINQIRELQAKPIKNCDDKVDIIRGLAAREDSLKSEKQALEVELENYVANQKLMMKK